MVKNYSGSSHFPTNFSLRVGLFPSSMPGGIQFSLSDLASEDRRCKNRVLTSTLTSAGIECCHYHFYNKLDDDLIAVVKFVRPYRRIGQRHTHRRPIHCEIVIHVHRDITGNKDLQSLWKFDKVTLEIYHILEVNGA